MSCRLCVCLSEGVPVEMPVFVRGSYLSRTASTSVTKHHSPRAAIPPQYQQRAQGRISEVRASEDPSSLSPAKTCPAPLATLPAVLIHLQANQSKKQSLRPCPGVFPRRPWLSGPQFPAAALSL